MYQIPYQVAKQAMAGYSAHFEKWASQSPSWNPDDPNVVAAFAQEYEVKMAAQQAEEEKIASDSDMAGTRMADAFVGRLQEYGFDLGAFGVKEAAEGGAHPVRRVDLLPAAEREAAHRATRVEAVRNMANRQRSWSGLAGLAGEHASRTARSGWAAAKEHAGKAVDAAKRHPYAAGAGALALGGGALYAAHRHGQKKSSDIQFDNDVAYAADYYANCLENGEHVTHDTTSPYTTAVSEAAFDLLREAGW